jgi:hypothetical protein
MEKRKIKQVKTLLNTYRQWLVVQDIPSPYDYPSLKEKVLISELNEALEYFNGAIRVPKTFDKKFKTYCQRRNRRNDDTCLSYAAMPYGVTNQLCWQLAKLVFNSETLGEMLAILMPVIKQVVSLSLTDDYPGATKSEMKAFLANPKLQLNFQSLQTLTSNIGQSSCLNEYVITDDTIFKISDIARFPFAMQQQLYMKFKQQTPALFEKLYSYNPMLVSLYSDICHVEYNGLNGYQALERLIKGLLLGGEKLTGQPWATIESLHAFMEFVQYWDMLPVPLKTQLSQLTGTSKKNLQDIIDDLERGDCVETAAINLGKIIANKKNHKTLTQNPLLSEEKINSIKKKYKMIAKRGGLDTVGSDKGYKIPGYWLSKHLAKITIHSAGQLINLLIAFHCDYYEALIEFATINLNRHELFILGEMIGSGIFNKEQTDRLLTLIAGNTATFGDLKHVLFLAAMTKDMSFFKIIYRQLKENKDYIEALNQRDKDGNTLLHLLVDDNEIIKTILSLLPNDKTRFDIVSHKNDDGDNLFHLASSNIDSCKAIVESFSDIKLLAELMNTKDGDDDTMFMLGLLNPQVFALLLSIYTNDREKIAALIKKNEWGYSILHLASGKNLKLILDSFSSDRMRLVVLRLSHKSERFFDSDWSAIDILAKSPQKILMAMSAFTDKRFVISALEQKNQFGESLIQKCASNRESLKTALALYPDDRSRLNVLVKKDGNEESLIDKLFESSDLLNIVFTSFSDEAVCFELVKTKNNQGLSMLVKAQSDSQFRSFLMSALPSKHAFLTKYFMVNEIIAQQNSKSVRRFIPFLKGNKKHEKMIEKKFFDEIASCNNEKELKSCVLNYLITSVAVAKDSLRVAVLKAFVGDGDLAAKDVPGNYILLLNALVTKWHTQTVDSPSGYRATA